jgi:nitrogen fixation/metabolism regulation signal transduction histidine kinase
MVNDFRDYARLPPPKTQPLDLNRLVLDVLDLYAGGPIQIAADLQKDLPLIEADADQMRQVLHNLIKNAHEAMQEKLGAGGTARILLTTRRRERMAELVIADEGPGFPREILEHAFEPYVTTKPKGTGLGLAIVHKIIVDHRGVITLANRPEKEGGGARVCIQLPLSKEAPSRWEMNEEYGGGVF